MWIIDRIVQETAVCETDDRAMVEIPLGRLPDGVKEGDCIEQNETGNFEILTEETKQRKEAMKVLFQKRIRK